MTLALCPTREELQDYIRGKLPDDASDSLAEHLDGCSQCQAELASLSDADDTLIARLKCPETSDPYVVEPKYQEALARAKSLFAACGAGGGISPDGSTTFLNQQLGEYFLIERLGRGGMGTVYKARQRRLDRVVALKILSRGRTGDAHAVVRFEREMKAIGRLDHPNIVKAYDAREIDGTLVLIMEFIDGLDLSDIARRIGPLPMADACEMVRRTAIALQYAHEHGLVHRDIKPSNIMLSRSGEVKLLDLGLARFFAEVAATDVNNASNDSSSSPGEEMTVTGQAMGTADYMAPEQASDSRTVDIRADIYSLGCTLYKLLSGRAPFGGPEYRGTLDKMNAHVHETPPPIKQFVPELPDELVAIIDRMLAKNPADRFATPAEVAAALEKVGQIFNLSKNAGQVSNLSENTGQIKNLSYEANLPNLIDRAISLPREQWAKAEKSQDANFITPRPASSPVRRRPIAKYLFLGLAFFGLLGLAFAAGILITIKRAGKPESTIEAPEGSNFKFNEQGNLRIELPPGEDKDYVMVDLSAKDAKATLPPEPYKIGIGDYLCIRAAFTLPDCPIDGIYRVEPNGTVPLPPAYGRAKVDGLSLVEAEKAIANKLNEVLRNPEVSVTLAGWKKRSANTPPPQPHKIAPGDILNIWVSFAIPDQPINGPYLVEPDGQLTLGPAYGRVNVKGLTFEEAEKVVTEKLSETLRNPEVSITLEGWRKLLRTPVPENSRERKKPEGEQKTNQPPPSEAQIKIFSLHNSDAATLMQEIEKILPTNGQPGLAKALGKEKVEHPLRLSLDARTNSIIVSGDADALAIVDALVKRMEETPTKAGPSLTNNESKKSGEKPEEIPLSQAVKELNAKIVSTAEVKNASPLTEDEVVSVLRELVLGGGGRPKLAEATTDLLNAVVENGKLPSGCHLLSDVNHTSEGTELGIYFQLPYKNPDKMVSIRHERIVQPIPFQTAKITRGDITATITAEGMIEPEVVVDVQALVSGNVSKVVVDYNSPVEKDQILAQIDDTEYRTRLDNERAGLEGTKAKLKQAEAKAALAKSEFENGQTLNQKAAGTIPMADLNKLRVNYEVAQAVVEEAQANVKQSQNAVLAANDNLASTVIKSPIKGIVIARRVNVGQNVAADSKEGRLFQIAKEFDKMQIQSSVGETEFNRLHEGMEATFKVDAFPNEVFKAKVKQIRLSSGAAYPVILTFDNPGKKLLPYMMATVRFEVESHKNVLLVSNRALRWKPKPEMLPIGWTAEIPPDYVSLWTKSADGKHVEPVNVKLGISDSNRTVVIGPDDLEGKEIIIGDSSSSGAMDNLFKPVERNQPPQPQAVPDEQVIQGTWEVVSSTFSLLHKTPDAKEIPGDQIQKTTKIVIADNRLKIVGPYVTNLSFAYQLNPNVQTKMLDLQTGGGSQGLLSYGIYSLERDELKISTSPLAPSELTISATGETIPPDARIRRPQNFWSELGSGKELLVLRRAGKASLSEDEKNIRGTWKVEKYSREDLSLGFKANSMVEITDLGFSVHYRPDAENLKCEFGYAINAALNPKRIDIPSVMEPGFYPVHGIYVLKGDELTIHWAFSPIYGEGPIPADFNPTEKTTLVTLKRVSAAEQKASAAQPAGGDAEAGLKSLKGKWKLMKVEKGKEAPVEGLAALPPDRIFDLNEAKGATQFIIDDSRLWVREEGQADLPFNLKNDPNAAIKTLDLYDGSILKANGIYELIGDQLKICLTKYQDTQEKTRPKSFSIAPDSRDILLVLERVHESPGTTADQNAQKSDVVPDKKTEESKPAGAAGAPAALDLLHGVEKVRKPGAPLKIKFEFISGTWANLNCEVEGDGDKLRFEQLPRDPWPGRVVIKDGDSFYDYLRQPNAAVKTYNTKYANSQGTICFDPRALGLGDNFSAGAKLHDYLNFKGESEFSLFHPDLDYHLLGREVLDGVGAWRIKRISDDEAEYNFWITDKNFHVIRKLVRFKGEMTDCRSSYDDKKPEEPLPVRIQAQRFSNGKYSDLKILVSSTEWPESIPAERFTLKSMDLPKGTYIESMTADNPAFGKVIGTWDGEKIENMPSELPALPSDLPPDSRR